MDSDAMRNDPQQYSQVTTFKDKFEVAWIFIAPYLKIDINHNKIDKTVSKSKNWREVGNREYTTAGNKDYLLKSIEAYTKSIAHAPTGSKELSLAYANRSAVLFRARLYEDCLLDIERSLKAGHPKKLKTKLFLRQSLCFKALKPNSELEPSISMANAIRWLPFLRKYNSTYDFTKEYQKMINNLKEPRKIIEFIPRVKNENAIIVDASDAIELRRNSENNQHIVATRDIKTGEFIHISEPFAAALSNDSCFTNCWHCCRQTWAGVPCDYCSTIIYCSDLCKRKAWRGYHNLECSVLRHIAKDENVLTHNYLTVKLFLKTLKSVGGLIELKRRIDNIDSMKNKDRIFINGILDVNTANNVLNLDYFEATSTKCTFGFASFVVLVVAILGLETDILGEKMTMKDLIQYENEKLLIMGELLLRHMMIVHRNNSSFFVNNVESSAVVLPFSKILKPSCDSNVDWIHVGSKIGYFAVKPIKQGEPLLASKFGPYHTMSKTKRYFGLGNDSDYPLICECRPCVENWPTMTHLPFYQDCNIRLPAEIKKNLDDIALTFDQWSYHIGCGDPELVTMKDHLNRINDMFHQYITFPCKEISQLYILLKSLYARLYTVHAIYE